MDSPFVGKGLLIAGIIHLSGREAYDEARRGALIVDVREPYDTDYKKFDVPEVLYLPYRQHGNDWNQVPKDRPVIVADSVGQRSKEVVQLLQGQGWTNLANLNCGMVDWERDGLPMVVDKDAELHGQCVCRLKRRGKK